jgi:hypothetical protein
MSKMPPLEFRRLMQIRCGANTHTNQSTANRRETSSTGASIVDNTIKMSKRAALGTLTDEKLAAVDAKLYRQKTFVPY